MHSSERNPVLYWFDGCFKNTINWPMVRDVQSGTAIIVYRLYGILFTATIYNAILSVHKTISAFFEQCPKIQNNVDGMEGG